MNQSLPTIHRRLVLVAATACFVAAPLLACQVPVFRYALERWPADSYEVVVLHEGPLADDDQKRLDKLRASKNATPANVNLRAIEAADLRDELLVDVWKNRDRKDKSLMVTLYPRNAQEVPDRVVEVSPFTDKAIAHLADSPLRQEIAKKLISGDSAVWIFVPGSDAKQNAVALETLNEQVLLNEQQLELPPQEEIESDEAFLEEVDIELRLDFSIVTLNRNDPKEAFLLKMLLASEPDLEQLDQPMAFPVLGRGRVLYALVGKGIVRETIGMASRFIVGPCSCQVKEQNPGFDLLMSFDWDAKVGGAMISDPLPATTGKPILLTIPPGKSDR